jgi:hypothetical protein
LKTASSSEERAAGLLFSLIECVAIADPSFPWKIVKLVRLFEPIAILKMDRAQEGKNFLRSVGVFSQLGI